jgi:hypothetical protein
MSRYYSSTNNGTKTPPGGGSWARVTYGSGGDYSADTAQMLSDAALLSQTADFDVSNREPLREILVPSSTVSGTTTKTGTAYAAAPIAAATRGRPRQRLAHTDTNCFAAPVGANSVDWPQADMDTVQGHLTTYVGRTAFAANCGANRDRAWLTFEVSPDCDYFFWDDTPTWLTGVSCSLVSLTTRRVSWTADNPDTYYDIDVLKCNGGVWSSVSTNNAVATGYVELAWVAGDSGYLVQLCRALDSAPVMSLYVANPTVPTFTASQHINTQGSCSPGCAEWTNDVALTITADPDNLASLMEFKIEVAVDGGAWSPTRTGVACTTHEENFGTNLMYCAAGSANHRRAYRATLVLTSNAAEFAVQEATGGVLEVLSKTYTTC